MSLKAAAASPVLLYFGCSCFKIWLWELCCIIQSLARSSSLCVSYLCFTFFTNIRIIDSKVLKDHEHLGKYGENEESLKVGGINF